MAVNCIKAEVESLEEMQGALNPYPHLAGGISTYGVALMVFETKYKEYYGIEPPKNSIKSEDSYRYTRDFSWMTVYTDGSHDSQRFKIIWRKSSEECPKQMCCCKFYHYLESMGPYEA